MQPGACNDQAVTCTETVGDIAREVQPLFDQDLRIGAREFCLGQLLQHELHIAVGVIVHLVTVVLTDWLFGAQLQGFPELMLTESVSSCAFRGCFCFLILKLLL